MSSPFPRPALSVFLYSIMLEEQTQVSPFARHEVRFHPDISNLDYLIFGLEILVTENRLILSPDLVDDIARLDPALDISGPINVVAVIIKQLTVIKFLLKVIRSLEEELVRNFRFLNFAPIVFYFSYSTDAHRKGRTSCLNDFLAKRLVRDVARLH